MDKVTTIKTFALPVAFSVVIIFMIGFLAGRMNTVKTFNDSHPLVISKNDFSTVPTIKLSGIEDSQLKGSIKGEVRLFIGEDLVIAKEPGQFLVPAGPLLRNFVTVIIPKDMNFVASKKGSKYYPVESAGAEKLSPQNRVYFKTRQEAESAGYTK